jgi:hypothetical protein
MVVNLDYSVSAYGWSFQNGYMTLQIPVDPGQMQWFLAAVTDSTLPGQRVTVTRTSSVFDAVNGVYLVEVTVNNTSQTPGFCHFDLQMAETQ